MKINRNRLTKHVSRHGFTQSQAEPNSLTFVRPDARRELFQKIHVDCQGKRSEYVYGNVSVSVVKHMHLKIDARNHLMELDVNKERYWTLVESDDQAKAWENHFADVAPRAADSWAHTHGDALLRRTEKARVRSANNLRKLTLTRPLGQQIQAFEAMRGSRLVSDAMRLAAWPGVMQIYGAEELYTLACCAVLSGDESAEYAGQDPLRHDELMWQIQIVADGILLGTEGQ